MPEFYDQEKDTMTTKPRMTAGEKTFFFGIIPVVLVSALVAVILFLLPGQDEPTVNYAPSNAPNAGLDLPLPSVNGTWTDNNGLVAVVENDTIEIMWTRNNSSMLYWVGTFNSSASDGDIVTSAKTIVRKPVLSQADSKDFTIKHGRLFFELTAMGSTKTVEMSHV